MGPVPQVSLIENTLNPATEFFRKKIQIFNTQFEKEKKKHSDFFFDNIFAFYQFGLYNISIMWEKLVRSCNICAAVDNLSLI